MTALENELNFDFDFFESTTKDEASTEEFDVDAWNELISEMIDASLHFEAVFLDLRESVEVAEEDQENIFMALKTMDAYIGLLTRAVIAEQVRRLDTTDED